VVIEPETQRIHWADFGAYERCITAGAEATQGAVHSIRQLLRHERVFSVLRSGTGKKKAEAHLQSNEFSLCFE
jgi:hypothetical protein